jgi:hypothetical protein
MNRLLLALLSFALLVACGGNNPGPANPTSQSNGMDDALALLPGNAIAVGTLDARAQASRDIDRVTFGSYSYSGIDAAAVVVGRFDDAKIHQAAAAHTPTKNGGYLVQSQYAGRDVFTINNVGFTILSPTKAIAGTESGIRRVLERIKDGRVRRDIPQWMLDTVETPGAAAAVACDFATQPMPAEAMRQVPLAFIQTSKAIRLLFTFQPPGVQLAGSLTYADPQAAAAASDQTRQALAMVRAPLALLQVKIQNVDVKTDKSDVQVKLDVDDGSLRQVLATAPQWLGP